MAAALGSVLTPPLAAVALVAVLVAAPCCLARPSTYGSAIYHVQSPVPSSHQSVTLSEEGLHSSDSLLLERAHDHPLPYKFEYKVHDQKNHNYHERAESSDGQVVRGFYSLLEPHGEVRVVKYRADHGGFQSEVSRHGSRHGGGHGGGLGATIGAGPAHDLGSHGLGVSAAAPLLPAPAAASVSVTSVSAVKHSIPIHEDHQEDNSPWSVIEDPQKGPPSLRGQALEETPAPSKEALGKPGPPRVPEQILLQQQKKKATLQALHAKPNLLNNKYLKRPQHHGGPPLRPGGPGGPRHPPPHFHHHNHHHHHRGPKRAGPGGPRPSISSSSSSSNGVVAAGGPPPPPPPSLPLQRREARPPPTPCKCSKQPPGHAAGHPSSSSHPQQQLAGRKLT